MIISASRRTDIPALFSEWFYTRIGKGFVLLRNPYNPRQIGRVTLTPDLIDGFVFWTKNAAPMLPRIHELDAFKYYFQFTITPYGKDVERNIPDKKEVIIPAFRQIGTDKVIWRYDPIFINEKYSWEYHLRAFEKIAAELEGHTNKAVISFVDYYRTVDLRPLGIIPLPPEQQYELAQQLSEIAASHGITLTACAENLGIKKACCVDGEMFGVNKPKDRNQRGLCTCVESIDIGAYNTCKNGCVYCYANHHKRLQETGTAESDILGKPLIGNEIIKQRN